MKDDDKDDDDKDKDDDRSDVRDDEVPGGDWESYNPDPG